MSEEYIGRVIYHSELYAASEELMEFLADRAYDDTLSIVDKELERMAIIAMRLRIYLKSQAKRELISPCGD